MSFKTTALTIVSALGVTACQSDSSSTDSNGNNQAAPIGSQQVCALDDSGNVAALVNIDTSTTPSMIDSGSAAALDIDIEAYPIEEQFKVAFASIAFTAPFLSDIFAATNVIYACTDEIYALNQCNWQETYDVNGVIQVATTLASDQTYTSIIEVSESASAAFNTLLEIQGTVGDLGNITIKLYEAGDLIGTRVSTLSSSGAESVTFTSDLTNWYAEESANCAGTLTYEDVQQTQTIAVDASWSLQGSSTTGQLTAEFIDDTPEAVTINW